MRYVKSIYVLLVKGTMYAILSISHVLLTCSLLAVVYLFQITLRTVHGQNLDMISGASDIVDFTNYTSERYKAIVKWKTAYYSFYLPVACAMYMVSIKCRSSFVFNFFCQICRSLVLF